MTAQDITELRARVEEIESVLEFNHIRRAPPNVLAEVVKAAGGRYPITLPPRRPAAEPPVQ
jgi:hypothetical protein